MQPVQREGSAKGKTLDMRTRLRGVNRRFGPTLKYWMETEVHVYAFSVAANVLLSFFPFLIVMLSLCRNTLHWKAATDAIYLALNDYFPETLGLYLKRNLIAKVGTQQLQFISMLLLLFTANGVFEPLEVALNRIWGITTNRPFWKNQLISLGLIFACGGLALISTALTALNTEYLRTVAGGMPVPPFIPVLFFKLAAVPVVMLMLFLIYWLLPNGEVPVHRALPAAIVVGVLLEILKYINIATWPSIREKMDREYGPFQYSATLILWAFFATLLVLAGAEWAARREVPDQDPEAAVPPLRL